MRNALPLQQGSHLVLPIYLEEAWLTCMQASHQCMFAKMCEVLPRIKAKGSSKVLQIHMQASEGAFVTLVWTYRPMSSGREQAR